MGRGFVLIVFVAAITMCTLHKKEECRYSGQTASFGEFSLVGRLEGTFYEKSGGDVKAPYTLYIFIEARHDVLSYTVRNLVVYQALSTPLLQIERPPVKSEKSSSGGWFQFLEIPNLNLQYKRCFVELDVFKEGKMVEKIRFVFNTDFSSEWTTAWLERLLSV
jgi:hypothetical protein